MFGITYLQEAAAPTAQEGHNATEEPTIQPTVTEAPAIPISTPTPAHTGSNTTTSSRGADTRSDQQPVTPN